MSNRLGRSRYDLMSIVGQQVRNTISEQVKRMKIYEHVYLHISVYQEWQTLIGRNKPFLVDKNAPCWYIFIELILGTNLMGKVPCME